MTSPLRNAAIAAVLATVSAGAVTPVLAHNDSSVALRAKTEIRASRDDDHARRDHGRNFITRLRLKSATKLESVRDDFTTMTKEERTTYRADAKAFNEEQKASFEAFVGLDREEIKEVRKDGQSMGDILTTQGHDRDDTEVFLTARGEARIDFIDDRHDLSDEDETTLRDRITGWISRTLLRWFN